MKQNLRKILILLTLSGLCNFRLAVVQAQTLHGLIIADVEDKEFGMVSIGDQFMMNRLFESVRDILDIKLQTTYLEKARFNSEAIKKTIEALNTQPNDMIWVYYNGLGYYPAKSRSKYPFFKLSDYQSRPFSLDQLASLLQAKGVRLSIVMADCRNYLPPPTVGMAPLIFTEDIRKLILTKLLLERCGVVKVASGQKGQKVTTSIGGSAVFTNNFMTSFHKMLSHTTFQTLHTVSLESLFAETQSEVKEYVSSFIHKDSIQKALWSSTACTANLQRFAVKMPSYRNVWMTTDINKELNRLVLTRDLTQRQKIIEKLKTQFSEKATVTLSQTASNGSIRKRSPLPIDQFWQQMTPYDANLQSVYVMFADVKRSSDLRYVEQMTLHQTLK